MTDNTRPDRITRRTLLRTTATAAAVAAGLPLLTSCTSDAAPTAPMDTTSAAPDQSSAEPAGAPNVRVSNDSYGVHVEPSVAANPRNGRQLFAACQVSPTADPEFIATYVSSDAGATWHSGGVPRLPAGATTTGDDVTVAFDTLGRGYLCATSYGGGRAVYVWRTDDGGRTFSVPVTLLSGQYCDHPWLAVGGQGSAQRNIYVVWAAGNKSALGFTRSTDAGETFEPTRTILPDGPGVTALSAGPALAAGANGLVCAVCDRTTRLDPSGEVASQVVAVCSTDAGRNFGPPVTLGPESPIISLPGGVMPDGSPTVAVAPDGHALYVAFTRHQPGATHSDIVVTESHDAGRTWSEAVSATPSDSVTYFQPNLTVDSAGRVAISAFALHNGHVDLVLLVSQPGKLRFGSPRRVTTVAFDPAHSPTNAGKHGAWWIGDYQGIAWSNGAFHLMWNDTRTGKLELFAATVRP